MEFSRQEYWSGLRFPSPGHLPYPGIELWSPTLWADTLSSKPPGNLRRAETKRKKEFNLEAWEKETSNTISLKKRQINTTQMKEQTGNTEV